jgi:endothelin-converting enzyme/putative endopeptidase
MYKFACGHYNDKVPLPEGLLSIDPSTVRTIVNVLEVSDIVIKAAVPRATRSPEEQKIGDYYSACMNTDAIEAAGLKPIQPLLDEIAGLTTNRAHLATLVGRLQRVGVDVFFRYGDAIDFQHGNRQIAAIVQSGLGIPAKDDYLDTSDDNVKERAEYVAHVARMLALAGTPSAEAEKQAQAVMKLETALAKASLSADDLGDPEMDLSDPKNIHDVQSVETLQASLPSFDFAAFEDAIHSPRVSEIDNVTPDFWSELTRQITTTDTATIQAYLRYHLLTAFADYLPRAFDAEASDGQPEMKILSMRCVGGVIHGLSDAVGRVYAEQYFAGDSKARMLEMVHGIEAAMGTDINQADWMSATTKQRAHQKLAAIANLIGNSDKGIDYSKLVITTTTAAENQMHTQAFENDRKQNEIGKPDDSTKSSIWDGKQIYPTAYYDITSNSMDIPVGSLQPPFFSRTEDDAVNYGHIGAIIGHEIIHGYDSDGHEYDGKGSLNEWWTPEDIKSFAHRSDCLADEYSAFTAVEDKNPANNVHVNGRQTLNENIADNGGILLAFMAYMQHAKEQHIDLTAKRDGFTPPQRFYIAYAQNTCQNATPELIRTQVLQDDHSPGRFRVNGVVVNQPGFASAFGCKPGAPMAPVKSCHVW